MEPDGSHFLAVTDSGSWLRGRIVYKDGRPDGIADTEVAPILGCRRQATRAHGWFDVESLTERDGLFYVGIERVEQIVRFDLHRDGLVARGEAIAVPPISTTFPTTRVWSACRGAEANRRSRAI